MKNLVLVGLIMVLATLGCRKSSGDASLETKAAPQASEVSDQKAREAAPATAASTPENQQAPATNPGSDGLAGVDDHVKKPAVQNAYFTLEIDEITTRGSGTNSPSILIHPAAGKRWDQDFQATARVVNPGGLAPERTQFDKQDFVERRGTTRLVVPVATSKPGRFNVEVALDFSVCDDQGCKTFKNVPATIPFTVN